MYVGSKAHYFELLVLRMSPSHLKCFHNISLETVAALADIVTPKTVAMPNPNPARLLQLRTYSWLQIGPLVM